ncbi:ubiquinone biosynthesis methyltransferase UbiE [Zhengella mangrovi]|uniref:Ubiquinone biosynthesis methyltransferase UbiE n=1 Tax=Zhengella mangrovi TaxID=1982044 RepID=A0A2G1QK88_9HYPH|nr:class I SAM-dependent methyltransferase [Zhengella mangrovi]PHP65889.1 ubiquinone biosynthesis methyltransferase UbiE [Zhengella mangrovi]
MALNPEDIEPFVKFEQDGWEGAASAYHDHWGGLSAQSSAAMLQAAGIGPGSRVLDIATGAGYVAAAAANMGAISTGLDFAHAQVALARQLHPEIDFCQGNAQDLPFESETFDAVVMGFGMNHLPDPEKAATEAWRVLRPGGAFAFTVWAPPSPGEGFGIVLSAIQEHGVPNPKLPAAPPYFRFADKREVEGLLGSAGFGGISIDIIPQVWQHTTPDQLFDAFNEGAVRATAMLRSQPESVREIIRSVVRQEVSKLKYGDKYLVPVPAVLSVGFKQS